jgi:ribosomal subunit interface protein
MKLLIRARKVALDPALHAHVQRRLDFALARFGNDVGQVTVTLSDAAERGDGAIGRCRIDANLWPTPVSAEDENRDLFAAVTHAAHRLARSIARALDRERRWHDGSHGNDGSRR